MTVQSDVQLMTLATESELLDISMQIRAIGDSDTLAGWLTRVIESEPKLARYLDLPKESKAKSALLTITLSLLF